MGRSSTVVDTAQIVYSDDTYSPLIGNDATDTPYDFAPWKWDERIWMRQSMENLDSSIPTLWDQPWIRIPQEYILSGIGSVIDLEVLKIVKQRKESIDVWVPEIRHGNYFKFTNSRYLFADRSVIQYVDTDDNEGLDLDDITYPDPTNPLRNTLQLTHIPRHGSPISATLWGRNIDDDLQVIKLIRKKIDFTGKYDTDGEMATRHGIVNEIKWNAVDQSKKEFIVDYTATPPKLVFNQDFTYLIGRNDLTSNDELEYLEFLGRGTHNATQLFLTRRFPIVDNTEIMLITDQYSSEWARFIDLGQHGVRITEERDSGEKDCNHQAGHKVYVEIGGATRPEDRGVYSLDTDRGEITFPDFLVTNPDDAQVGTVITRPPASGDLVYLRYRPTIEVEYEPEDCNRTVRPNEFNLNPIGTTVHQGFIYVSEQDMRGASIVLTVEKPLMYGKTDVYGPVLVGSDYAFLVATVYSRFDVPVPGVTVEFYLPDYEEDRDLGRLGGHEGTTTAITNGNGQARIAYTPPRSAEEIGVYIKHPGGDTSTDLTLPTGTEIDSDADIYTYTVWHGDRWSPYDITNRYGGQKRVVYEWDEDAIHPRTGMAGAYAPLQPDEITPTKLVYPSALPNTIVDGSLTATWTEGEHLDPLELAAYWISAGKNIEIKARAYSTLYNRNIISDSVYLRIDLPEYMKGTYVAESIGSTPPSRIPYGFRLFDEYFQKASGLDGLTYLSINPASGYWGIAWPDDVNGFMSPTHRIEFTNPFLDGGRYLWLDNQDVIALTGHTFLVGLKTSGTTGHKFYVPPVS